MATKKGPTFTAPKSEEASFEEGTCYHDAAMLTPEGFCPAGGGFPYLRYVSRASEKGHPLKPAVQANPCPFVCPLCRHPLEWDGRCEACHGCTTAKREDWTFPGDRYERHDDTGQPLGDGSHWIKVDGPRPVATSRSVRPLISQIMAGQRG